MAEQHKADCARAVRRQGLLDGRSDRQIAEEIHRHCAYSLLRAYRFARGWSLEQVVTSLREIHQSVWGVDPPLAHQRVSQWERGADLPSPRYQDALCRLYRTRPDLLGFGRDYSDMPAGPEPVVVLPPAAAEPAAPSEQRNDMDRRQLIQMVGVYTGLSAFAPVLQTLRATRIRTTELLETQSVGATSVDDWEELVHDYGYRRLGAPLQQLLVQMVGDFDELREVLSRRQPLEFQRRLYRVAAQLAVLIAVQLNDAADFGRETHGWFHTARLAADETGDRALRAWVIAKEGMTYLWYDRPVQRSVVLSRQAQTLAGSGPSVFGSYAASVEARALARLGRREEAMAAVRLADTQFQRLVPAQTDVNVLGFYEHLLRFHLENALTTLGETAAAMEQQDRAFELLAADATDANVIKLDRAFCLVRSGELAEGCRVAARALTDTPPDARNGIALCRAQDVARLIHPRDEKLGEVRELFSALRTG